MSQLYALDDRANWRRGIRARRGLTVDLVRSVPGAHRGAAARQRFHHRMRRRASAPRTQAEPEIARPLSRPAARDTGLVKDLVDVAGTPTTSGFSGTGAHPATDAPIVRRLREAGAVLIGKTNLHEFAFGTTSDESAFGPVRNPLDPSRVGRRIERRLGARSPCRRHVLSAPSAPTPAAPSASRPRRAASSV